MSLSGVLTSLLLLLLHRHVTGVDACQELTCQNGGTCNNGTCVCASGFTGVNCSTGEDACQELTCQNGGTCNNGTCVCAPGFTGVNCSTGKSKGSKAAIIGGCVTAAALILALVIVIIVLRCRQRRARTGGKRFTRIETRADNGLDTAPEEGSSSAVEMQAVHAANLRDESPVPHIRLTPEVLPDVVARTRDDINFLAAEFERLPRGLSHPATVALNVHNKGKNRYRGICAYDHSRVVLNTLPGKPHSDYVNACYLHGYKREKAYIAAQGPTDVNVEDFLRMIWEKKVEKIAMLTRPMEMGQMKCVQYWDDDHKATFGNFTVTVARVQEATHLTERLLLLQPADGAVRTVTHFLFKSWPDKGVPDSPWSLIDFHHKLMTSPSTESAPILVHCSAGVGRTGTLVALDVALQRLQHEGGVTMHRLVAALRTERVDLVQTLEQYTFLHEAALVGLCCAGRFIRLEHFPSDAVANDVTLIEKEFKAVRAGVRPLSPAHCSLGALPEYRALNRYQHILPPDTHLVWLNEPQPGYQDYINAIFLPSYTEERRYVLTETPMPHTVVNFWRAVFEADVAVIVSLDVTSPDPQANVGEFVGQLQTGPLTVKLLQSRSEEGFLHRTMQASLEGRGARTVEQVEVWGEEPALLLRVCQTVLQWRPQSRVLVHCRDGGRRSGLYVALSTLLERSRSEEEVAVPCMVGALASVRPQALPSQEQYALLYAAMTQYASSLHSDSQQSGQDGAEEDLYVNSTNAEGLYVNSCNDEGLYVNSTRDEGLYVNSANAEDLYANSTSEEDLYVNAPMLKHA